MGAATKRIVCRPLGGGHHPKGVRNRLSRRKSLDRVTGQYPFRVSSETNPPQSEDVDKAIADLLGEDAVTPDPWWLAGTRESLEE
jgi:hypothetical protein